MTKQSGILDLFRYHQIKFEKIFPLQGKEMSSQKQKKKTPKKQPGPQIEKLMEMPVTARLVLGECKLEIEEILKLGQGSMLELDTPVKKNLKLYINDEEIAKAKSVIVDQQFGAQITEISSTKDRLKDLTDPE